jgi:hypothetical protein
MAIIIDTSKAKEIAKKLKAEIDTNHKKHDFALIYENDKLIAKFGIRRSSANIGHDYVSKQLYISPNQANQLAQCPMKRHHWIEEMKKQNRL